MRVTYGVVCWVALVSLLSGGRAYSGVAPYIATDLGDGGAQAINNLGQVAGSSNFGVPFLYSGGVKQTLPTLGGPASSLGINDAGQVVGYSALTPGPVNEWHAFLYSGGVTRDLGTLGGGNSQAERINGAGQVAGWSGTASGATHAFLYAAGVMRDLGTLGGASSAAYGINDVGQVVGFASTSSGATHAFLYAAGMMRDLGTLGGASSVAYGINDVGQVVGWSDTASGATHAFLYAAGVMRDLGTLGGDQSRAFDINNAGQVVGSSFTVSGGGRHAFLYSNGEMYDVNSLVLPGSPFVSGGVPEFPPTADRVIDMNDRGQIACIAINPEGFGPVHAALLTPVPEPSSLVLLALGCVGLLGYALSPSRSGRRPAAREGGLHDGGRVK